MEEWLLRLEPLAGADPGDQRTAVGALLRASEQREVPVGEVLTTQGAEPKELLVVLEGSVRVISSGVGGDQVYGPGHILNWKELFLSAPAEDTVIAAAAAPGPAASTAAQAGGGAGAGGGGAGAAGPGGGTVRVLAVPAGAFLAAVRGSSGLASRLAQELGQQLERVEEEAKATRKRYRALAPYLVTAPQHGIIGASKYADRLRKQVVEAARDRSRKPVLIFGEPGLEKSNIAALVHFGGPGRASGPMAALDCALLDGGGAELFGRGDRAGLLELVGAGTLLLKNVHKMPAALLPKLLRLCAEGSYRPASPASAALAYPASPRRQGVLGDLRADEELLASAGSLDDDTLPPLRCSLARILMTGSKSVPQLEKAVKVVKVAPLRLRPADVKDLQRFALRQLARRQGDVARLAVSPAALKQLESYSWPGNITEVNLVVERAVLQAVNDGPAGPQGGRLNEEVFWFAKQLKDRFRVNLLAAWPPLRALLRSKLWPDGINFGFTAYVYPLVVALLLWGPQDRLHNPMLTVFWDGWWPLVFVAYPFLGRIWCAVCPFMIYGELMQRWRQSSGAKLLKWPREQAEAYGWPFLFSLFAAILVWEEVWDLPNTAALSGWLLLLITAGAVVCSAIFERRLWCRYLCPIGGMNGLFAKLSITEVRARQGVCAGECSTYHCYKGGCAQPPDGLESPGCPLYSHPAQLTDNRNCVNCMECLKACPNGSVEFRLRWPGADLWFPGQTTSGWEVAMMLMLLGAVPLHHLPQVCGQLGLDPVALGLEGVSLQHIAASAALLAAPGLAAWGADAAWRRSGSGSSLAPLVARLGSAVAGMLPPGGAGGGAGSGGCAAVAAAGAGEGLAADAQAALQEQEQQATAPAQAAPFVSLAYGYVPLVWAATLSHYLRPLLGEMGQLLPISAAMVGWEDAPLPVFEAHPAVISFLQGGVLLFGAAASAVLSRRLAGAPWSTFAPQVAGIALLTAELWSLILP